MREVVVLLNGLPPVRMYRAERSRRCGHFVVSRETTARVRLSRLRVLLSASLALAGCGYHSVVDVPAGERLCVRADAARVPYPSAVQAALSGARRELASRGALDDGSRGPCLVVSVTRVDEAPSGVTAFGGGASERPLARGVAVAVLGRGWVEAQAGGPAQHDSGDLRRAVHVETTSGLADSLRHEQAAAAAAEELGQAIARAVLGLPTAADAPL